MGIIPKGGRLMQTLSHYQRESIYNARCAAAIDSLKLFMKDAKNKAQSSLELSTLELIVETIGEKERDTEEVDLYVP